jgi:hypothetical protein
MPGLLKVGSTAGPVEKRVRDLGSPTGVPEHFRIEGKIPGYQDLKMAERKGHSRFEAFRTSDKREFFGNGSREAQLPCKGAHRWGKRTPNLKQVPRGPNPIVRGRHRGRSA